MTIFKYLSDTVSTFAGGLGGNSEGVANGVGTSATFSMPTSLAIDPTGLILYVGVSSENQLRQIVISTS